jgi:hypothetical protein
MHMPMGEMVLSKEKATREDVERLKKDWLDNPYWDIWETEGFEDFEGELREFQFEYEIRKRLEEIGDMLQEQKVEKREVDWCALYKREKKLRTEEMVRNAGLCMQNGDLVHALTQVVEHPDDEDAWELAERTLKQVNGCAA